LDFRQSSHYFCAPLALQRFNSCSRLIKKVRREARAGGCRKEERKAKLADAAQEAKEDGKAVETDALQSERTVPEGQVGDKCVATP
jgi:hypothetical protein